VYRTPAAGGGKKGFAVDGAERRDKTNASSILPNGKTGGGGGLHCLTAEKIVRKRGITSRIPRLREKGRSFAGCGSAQRAERAGGGGENATMMLHPQKKERPKKKKKDRVRDIEKKEKKTTDRHFGESGVPGGGRGPGFVSFPSREEELLFTPNIVKGVLTRIYRMSTGGGVFFTGTKAGGRGGLLKLSFAEANFELMLL